MRVTRNVVVRPQHLQRRHSTSTPSTPFLAVMPLALILAFIWPFGKERKVDMLAGTDTPAAHGVVTIKSGRNGNTNLDIRVQALAKPTSLTPPQTVYVVWLQQPGEKPNNQGELKVGKKLNGELHFITPYKRFKIFITAEHDALIEVPQGPQALTADVAQT